MTTEDDTTFSASTHTIEVVLERSSTGWAFPFINKRGSVSLYFDGSHCCNGENGAYKASLSGVTKMHSMAGDNFLIDGQTKETESNTWNTANVQHAQINSMSSSTQQYSIAVKIYAVRIYNRLLSTEEMLHNQEIDNERFGLGLTLQ